MNKLSESEAKRNISHLKQLQEIRDYKIKQERQRQEEQERKRKDISISINELKEIFLNLFSGKDQNGKEINVQRRGYLFEEFLKMISTSLVRLKIIVRKRMDIEKKDIC